MDERAEAEQRAAMPEPGDVQGAPGRHEKNEWFDFTVKWFIG